jgi:hypothetical protein
MMWTTQKLFLTLLLLVDFGRFLFFALTPWFERDFEIDALQVSVKVEKTKIGC